MGVDKEGWWFEHSLSQLQVCLSAEGAKNVFWPWLSPLRGWGSLTMTLAGKFVYMAHHFILLRLNPLGLCIYIYHPRLKTLGKIIHENLNLLYMNDEVKDTFTPGPMVSFRTSRKLSSYLVRAKLYPLERTVGSRKCSKKRCEVCENVQNSDTFQSSVTT